MPPLPWTDKIRAKSFSNLVLCLFLTAYNILVEELRKKKAKLQERLERGPKEILEEYLQQRDKDSEGRSSDAQIRLE